MNKKLDFEETKRISTTKGFLGYRSGIKTIVTNFDIKGLRKLNKDQIKAIIKKITCDYPHEYPMIKLQLGIK